MEKDNYYILKIILWLILFLAFGIIIIACKSKSSEIIMTVTGPVPSTETGLALTHEHIPVDFIGADSTGYFRRDREKVMEKAVPVVLAAKEKGIKTFFECTPAYLGRDPLLLKELSQKTGLIFITNTGYYGAQDNRYFPESFYSSEASAIADIWINEFRKRIEESGIKPGFIKIAVYAFDTLSPEHRKLITAAALTHLKTGLVIASHTGTDGPAKPDGGTFNGFTDIFDFLLPVLKSKGLTDADIDQILTKNPHNEH